MRKRENQLLKIIFYLPHVYTYVYKYTYTNKCHKSLQIINKVRERGRRERDGNLESEVKGGKVIILN